MDDGWQALERHSGSGAGWLDGLHVYRDYIFPGARKGTPVRWFDRGRLLFWERGKEASFFGRKIQEKLRREVEGFPPDLEGFEALGRRI